MFRILFVLVKQWPVTCTLALPLLSSLCVEKACWLFQQIPQQIMLPFLNRSCFSFHCPLNLMITSWAPLHITMCQWDSAHFSWIQSMTDMNLAGWRKKIANQEANHYGITLTCIKTDHLCITTSSIHLIAARCDPNLPLIFQFSTLIFLT